MKKALPVALMLIGLVLLAAGVYTVVRGFDAKGQVRDELEAQKIVTPEDASIPNAPVVDAATADAMADIIGVHATEATGGRTYAEMGRFLTLEGGDTSDRRWRSRTRRATPSRTRFGTSRSRRRHCGPACIRRSSHSTFPTS